MTISQRATVDDVAATSCAPDAAIFRAGRGVAHPLRQPSETGSSVDPAATLKLDPRCRAVPGSYRHLATANQDRLHRQARRRH
jgi:hypothetical protein